MKLSALKDSYVVWRPEDLSEVDVAAILTAGTQELGGVFTTNEEISVVCPADNLPENPSGEVEPGWRGLKIEGPLDFGLTGILNSVTKPLAEHQISIFAISTYDTDYVLIKDDKFEEACDVLEANSFEVQR